MPHATSTRDSKPRPTYFLVRTTGEVVPLIAVDELPPALEVFGVPRSIELEDTIGMLNLGLQKGSGAFYAVAGLGTRDMTAAEREGKVGQTIVQFPDSHKLLSGTNPPPDTTPHTPPNSPDGACSSLGSCPPSYHSSLRHSPSVLTASIPYDKASPSTYTHLQSPKNRIQNHASNQTPGQTQLCRHWCHHGICKWGQKCRYRHIMPMTLSGLQEVGLVDWPVWYRELNSGHFVNETMGAAVAHNCRAHGRGRGGMLALSNGYRVDAVASCCGGHGPTSYVPASMCEGVRRAKAERLRNANHVVVRGRSTGREIRSEELGEQIIARLKKMNRDANAKFKAEKEKEKKNGSMVMEKAQARDTRRWEDESEGDAGGGGNEGGSKVEVMIAVKPKGKLVEV